MTTAASPAPDALSATFAALADPTRRAILARLCQGEATVGELAAPFAMSLPAVSRHLKVLERAGLIERGRAAQWRPCRLEPKPLRAVSDWLDERRGDWERGLGGMLEEAGEGITHMDATTHRLSNGRAGNWFDLSRHFDAPRRLVFAAWSGIAHARHWFTPRGSEMTDGVADFREGGAWRMEITAEDGAAMRIEGEFLEIVPDRRIVVSYRGGEADPNLAVEPRIEATFTDEGTGTRLAMRMGPFAHPDDCSRHRFGWAATLAQLDAHLPVMIAAEPAPANEPVIRLVRSFAEPPARVWRAWSDPELLSRWWGPDGFATETHSLGFREGGHWHFTLRGPDGINYPNRIRFVAIDAPRRLSYHHQGEDETDDAMFESDVTLTETCDGGTRLILTMRFASVEVRDNVARAFGAIEGGRRSLARLAALLEATD